MKDLYVHGIVKDYDKSINSINKYLFTENERLNAIIDDYEERIDKAIKYLKKLYDNLDYYYQIEDGLVEEEIEELLEILGDKENE